MHGENGAAQGFLQGGTGPARGRSLIDHNDTGHAQFEDLQREVEVALEVGGIQHEHHAVRSVGVIRVEQGVSGHGLVRRLGIHAVRPRQVHQRNPSIRCQARLHLGHDGLHGDARQVGHLGARTGQEVEQ